jgi:hypothetical protein
MLSEKLGSYCLKMNLNTEGKSIWELYEENFLVDFWDFPSIFNDNEDTEDERDGYEVDPKLLGGL